MKNAWRLKLKSLCTAMLLSASCAALAQGYPDKPIRLIVPYAAGGSSDLVARVVAKNLTETLHVSVIVENMGGAGGIIGAQYVSRQAGDGYTLLLGTQSSQSIEPILHKPIPFDPLKDFTPISNLVIIPLILTAHPSVPAHSVKELIALARAKPNDLSFGSTGIGTSSQLAGELLKHMANVQIVHVPYKGGGPASADLLAGHISLLFGSLSTTLPLVKSGKLTALGVTDAHRSPAAPDVPAIAEQLPGYEFSQWLGLLGPANMPADVVNTIDAAIIKMEQQPDVKQSFLSQGLEPAANTPAEFRKFITNDINTMRTVIKEANVQEN